ncbi:glycerophosphodiester phosphodiesterase [Brachybacterium huguangmaarense]|uniref:Glycerophosphodiester phosphodiesterase n=1 Tax=Brachybacterium huguangmaarense TaxID=1652028 RepID=A0ABY6FXS5_9MICO|nr:glycerophosphodiester phosphodiesterase [Brachybacterium huguangmaarense]UYG15710.1 glycerophosphodiester phosphodiesterase [Brachybacterium huguangmaarense]
MTNPWTAPGTNGEESGAVGTAAASPAPGGPTAPGPLQRELVARTPLFPLRPLGVGEILGAATRIYRLRPRISLLVAAVVYAISFVLTTALSGASILPMAGQVQASMDGSAGATVTGPGDGEVLVTLGASLASGLVSLVAAQLVTIALSALAIGEATGTPLADAAVWRTIRRHGISAVLAGLVIAVATLVLWAVLVGLGLLPLLLTDEAHWWTIVPVLLALVLALAGSVVIWMRTALTAPALVVEKLGALGAIRRSLVLTRGRRRWRVLGVGALLVLLVYVLTQVLASAFGIVAVVAYVAILLAGGPGLVVLAMAVLLVLTMLGAYVASVLSEPFRSAGMAALYADQRMRWESWDVELTRRSRDARDAATAPSGAATHGGGPW